MHSLEVAAVMRITAGSDYYAVTASVVVRLN